MIYLHKNWIILALGGDIGLASLKAPVALTWCWPKAAEYHKRSEILSQNDDDSSHIDVAFVNLNKLELNESFVCNMLQNIFQCLPALMSHKVLVPGFLAFLLLLIEVQPDMSVVLWIWRVSKLHHFFVYFTCVFLNFWWRGHPRCKKINSYHWKTWLVVLFCVQDILPL